MKNILLTSAITLISSTSVYAEGLSKNNADLIYSEKSIEEAIDIDGFKGLSDTAKGIIGGIGGGGGGCCPTGFEKSSYARKDHERTRKQGLETREAIVSAIETSIFEQTLDLQEIIERQTAEQIKQFQAQTKALANYFTTQDERMRQRAVDGLKYDAMLDAQTPSVTCNVLTNLRRNGAPQTDTGTETAGSAIRNNPQMNLTKGMGLVKTLTQQSSGLDLLSMQTM